MARGELIRKLFKYYKMKNNSEFEKVALEVIAEEEQKNNHQLAKDLMRILEGTNGSTSTFTVGPDAGNLPQDREKHMPLVDIRKPDRIFPDIVLDQDHAEIIQKIMVEYRKAEVLNIHGLNPSNKILFCGPPGCGKTICTEIIAHELGIPLLYTRFDSIVSSYLGETSANLRKIFDFAASGRWVVMFDEFDAIGKARNDQNEHGELKRVVNSFLQMLDSFKSSSLVIAATNHEQLLDPALWRRFDEIVFFPMPTLKQIKDLLLLRLKNFPYELEISNLASGLIGMSYADVERICLDAIKSAIIGNQDKVTQATFDLALKNHKSRLSIAKTAYRKKSKDK